MKKILTIILLLISIAGFGQTNYYVKNGGNDGLTGLSDAQAWATLGRADDVTFVPGDTLFIARGSTFKEQFVPKGDGDATAQVVITAYGSGAKPIITARDTVNGWSDDGAWSRPWAVTRPNVWYQAETRTPLYWTAIRMWFDGVEKERPETFPPTSTKPWYWSGDDSLFVYSTTNPGSAFTSIEKATSFYAAFDFDTDNYFTLSYLDIEHFYICVEIDDADGIVIDSCDIKGFYGVNIYASVDSRDGEIKNCNFDTENTFVSDYEAKYTGDGIKVGGITNTWLIHDNYFKNWNHTSIVLESTDADRVDSIKVYDNEITAPDIDYGGWLGVLYTNGRGNEIYRNYIHNIQTRMQIQGENLKFYYNIIDTINAPPWYPKANNAGAGLYIAGLVGSSANNMKFYNNVIAHCEDYGIGLIHAATYANKYDNEFINNIIYECDDSSFYVSSGATVLDNVFKNNLIYKTGVTNTVYYRGAPNISVDTWNESDMSGDVVISNKAGDPLFSAGTFELTSTSPAVNAGINVDLTSDYVETAVPQGIYYDIGAYEFTGFPIATTGLGWEDILSKRNFKDAVNFAQGFSVEGVPIVFSGGEPVNIPGLTASASELNILDGATVTTAEVNYSDGVTSNIQTQIDSKLAKADSSATLGKKYATGKMLFDGLALKVNVADSTQGTGHYASWDDMTDGLALKADTADNIDIEEFLLFDASTDTLATRAYARSGGGGGLSAGEVATQINDTIVARLAAAVAGVRIADTAAMLLPYMHVHDTATMLSTYINHVDTATMLTPYTHVHDTATMLTPYINRVDTASMLTPYINRTDTAAMLAPYFTESEIRKADSDTIPIFVFGAGSGGLESDTALFTATNIYGAFYNDKDTIIATSLRAVLIAGTTPLGTDTLAIQVFWNDTINAVFAPTARLNTNYLPVTSTTLGTEDTSFNTSIIPPGVWVFCKSTAGTTGRKPKALYVTLYGFKRNRSY